VTFYVLAILAAIGAVIAAALTESQPALAEAEAVEGEALPEAA
jgi:hypothetical protein